MTDHKLNLLARAEKDGKPVHDLLIFQFCPLIHLGEIRYHPHSHHIPNPDPMALIAVCDTVKLDKYCNGWQCWITIEDNDWAVSEVYGSAEYHGSQAETIQSALADAIVKATKLLEPDNWEECENCHGLGGFKGMPSGGPMGQDPFPDEACGACEGTGIVIKEAENAPQY